MSKWLKINHDPSKDPFEWVELPDPGSSTFLPAVYRALSCDSIELVQTVLRGVCIYVDECGKLVPNWENNINQLASRLYAGTAYGDPIVGDVLVGELQRDRKSVV